MSGIRDVLTLLPPILASQWTISSPATTLNRVAILDSNDATYGTIQWLPPRDGSPWALLECQATKEKIIEVSRIQVTADIPIFLAIEDGDTPAALANYHDRALQWLDSLRAVVAANVYLQPSSLVISTTTGDVRWWLTSSKQVANRPLLGSGWRGIEFTTILQFSQIVTFQF